MYLLPLLLCTAPVAADAPQLKPETVSYRSGKETVRGLLYRPQGKGPFPAVVVIHGDFGVTDGIKAKARQLAERGYLVLAVDLYRGEAPKDLLDAHILDRGLPEERVRTDLKAAVDYLAGQPDVDRQALAVVGWDMGGGYALDTAIADGRLKAAVTCYGRPTTDARLLKPLRAAVLGIYAGKDEGIPADTREQLRRAMQKAGKQFQMHVYEQCSHGFLNPPPGKKLTAAETEAAADAWKRIEAFLAAQLRR